MANLLPIFFSGNNDLSNIDTLRAIPIHGASNLPTTLENLNKVSRWDKSMIVKEKKMKGGSSGGSRLHKSMISQELWLFSTIKIGDN